MQLAAMKSMTLLDVTPQMRSVQERSLAIVFLAFKGQNASVVVTVGLQLPMFLKGFVAGRTGVSLESSRSVEVSFVVRIAAVRVIFFFNAFFILRWSK